MNAKDQIAAIRKALKSHPELKKLSVRNGRGTAWGWVDISGSANKSGKFTDSERAKLVELGFSPGGNFLAIDPDERSYWVDKLAGDPELEAKAEPQPPSELAPEPEARRLEAVKITLKRAEGRHEDIATVTIESRWPDANLWKQADILLKSWATTAPDSGAYDKTDFQIEWEDGNEYNGRFDLQRKHATESNLLANHIIQHLMFYSGQWKPDHMTQEDYDRYMSQQSDQAEYAEYMETYAIGA